jgi:hypothetical protein
MLLLPYAFEYRHYFLASDTFPISLSSKLELRP